jgi:hypothetical protein
MTSFYRQHSSLTSKELAEKALEKMTDSQRLTLLLSMLRSQFENIKRGAVREIEIQASPYERERREEEREKRAIRAAERKQNDEVLSKKPWLISVGKHYDEWCNKTPAQRRLRLQNADPAYLKFMEDGGHEDLIYNYSSYGIEKAFKDFENKVREEVKLELTEELLASSFTVGDRSVTWGEATVDDHESRVRMLLYQAGGTVDTAKRHKAAVIMLTHKHLNKLNEVVAEQAVQA